MKNIISLLLALLLPLLLPLVSLAQNHAENDNAINNPAVNYLLLDGISSGQDGTACTNNLDCNSGHCQNGYCCSSGDCCNTPGDCSSYASPPVCDNSTTCQGQREDSTCTNFVCGSQSVADDSACNASIMANDCGLYIPVYCSGLPDQTAPVCPTSCTDNNECESVNYCDKGSGNCNGSGQCAVKPLDCAIVLAPVCSCDSTTYGNSCLAAAAGVNIDYAGSCQ